MPYIAPHRRDDLARKTDHKLGLTDTPGELNYLLTCAIKDYWEHHVGYQAINDIIGALEGAKLEFYRRIAVPYEDGKIKENGDVY